MEVLKHLEDIQSQLKNLRSSATSETPQSGNQDAFIKHLRETVNEVDTMQKSADKMAADIASGKNENIHETMLAATQAELGFNFVVQVRNRVLEAYQEIMRMQV
jgi:flagellar hook-basal body complex protein FliE